MVIIKYILFVFLSLVVTITAYIFNPIFAAFIDANGWLPWYLSFYQMPDNPATGDQLWKDEHPGMDSYELALSYMNRNPAQGFDQLLAAKVTMQTQCRVRGNIDIGDKEGIAGWYLITTEEGYFHFSYVWNYRQVKCVTGGFGWRLNNIVKKYEHKTMGQFIFTPGRFQDFGGK